MIWAMLVTVAWAPPAQAADEARLWDSLKQGGYVVLLRHAIAPGGGDPPGFRLEDCASQRNLSETGRRQARLIGEAFPSRDVPVARVLSSQWCRCKETALLLALGPVEEFPVLDSFFSDPSSAREQTEALRRFVSQAPTAGNTILVTHQVNITELTGVWPASGELVVIRPEGSLAFTVVGRLRPGG